VLLQKNFKDTVIIAQLKNIVYFRFDKIKNGATTIADRKYGNKAFHVSSHYDTAI
jgi:hypothetical protein